MGLLDARHGPGKGSHHENDKIKQRHAERRYQSKHDAAQNRIRA